MIIFQGHILQEVSQKLFIIIGLSLKNESIVKTMKIQNDKHPFLSRAHEIAKTVIRPRTS